MALRASWFKHTLQFRFDAGTSRGVLRSKDSYFLKVWVSSNPSIIGIGECSPLPLLSPDDTIVLPELLDEICSSISQLEDYTTASLLYHFSLYQNPALLFALETALLDLKNGGKRIIFPTPFTEGKAEIPINGLVWMGNESFMREQLDEKLKQGYTCIKLKIGAIDFEKEIGLLEYIRNHYSENEISIRVDANGAFSKEEAMGKLTRLSAFQLHSIEQPIKAGQWKEMYQLCQESPLPIALDEELIGILTSSEKESLLDAIQPPYIILKPTLVGGLEQSMEWISLAEKKKCGWWITSALEANIGLNAISQFTAALNSPLPQGLGTGQLYHNNIDSPLEISNGHLRYTPSIEWDLSIFS